MSTETPDIQELECRISKNIHLLEELLYGPKRKAELADALGVTKQTIYNRFTDLDEFDLVERQRDRYRLTIACRPIVEMHLQTLEAMENVFDARALLQGVPAEAHPPVAVLEAARPVLPEGHPEQVRNQFCEWVLDADEVRGLLPHVSYSFIDRLCERLRANRITDELALSTDSMTYLQDSCPEACCTFRESDSTLVVERSQLPPFGLVVVDEPRREAGLVGYTDDGYVCGFMRFPTERGHRWADERLATCIDERQPDASAPRVTTD